MTRDEFIQSHRLSLLSRAKSINNVERAGITEYLGPITTNGLKGLLPMEYRDWPNGQDQSLQCPTVQDLM